jgi:hypothetical protein
VYPTWKEARASEHARCPGARLVEDAWKKLPGVLARDEFGGFKQWAEVTLETEEVIATN